MFPFLSQEATNPQGFGTDTVTKMKTEGGEAAAGGAGQATEAAQLLASRTGNTAATPGIIDAAARNASKVQAENASGVDIANQQQKLKQTQLGQTGLENLYGKDVGAMLQGLGLSNQAIGDWVNADQATHAAIQGYIGKAEDAATMGLTAGSVGGYG